MKTKKNQFSPININLAHPMADYHLRLANAARKSIADLNDEERDASIYVAISSLTFGIEIYLKSLHFTINESNYDGHDLAYLWKHLPIEFKNYISKQFEHFFEEENEKWTNTFVWSPKINGSGKIKSFYQRGLNAEDILVGHRNAYIKLRYAYEYPKDDDFSVISYNINGLYTMSWIIRTIARHFGEEIQEAKKYNKGSKNQYGRVEYEGTWPKYFYEYPN